jgi:GNAT superfamily N-acetyltransferase
LPVHTAPVTNRPEDVRPASEDDLPALRELVDAAYGGYLVRMGRKPAPMLRDLRPHVQAGQVWIVGRPPVGLICLIPAGDAVLVDNVAVRPDGQGSGLGRILLEFAEDHARRLGRHRVRLYTNEVMVENLAIYRHLGYRETGRRAEEGYRRVFLEKALEPG